MVFRAQGESPAPGLGKASNLFAASRATSLQRADIKLDWVPFSIHLHGFGPWAIYSYSSFTTNRNG